MNESETYLLRLSLSDINTVLKSLGRMPFEEVYGIIHEIHKQVADQAQANTKSMEGKDPSQ